MRLRALQVNAFDFGIWHYALEDAAYRVRDVIGRDRSLGNPMGKDGTHTPRSTQRQPMSMPETNELTA